MHRQLPLPLLLALTFLRRVMQKAWQRMESRWKVGGNWLDRQWCCLRVQALKVNRPGFKSPLNQRHVGKGIVRALREEPLGCLQVHTKEAFAGSKEASSHCLPLCPQEKWGYRESILLKKQEGWTWPTHSDVNSTQIRCLTLEPQARITQYVCSSWSQRVSAQ